MALIVLWSASAVGLIALALALHLEWDCVIDKPSMQAKQGVVTTDKGQDKGGNGPAHVSVVMPSKSPVVTLPPGVRPITSPGGVSLPLTLGSLRDPSYSSSFLGADPARGRSSFLPSRRQFTSFIK